MKKYEAYCLKQKQNINFSKIFSKINSVFFVSFVESHPHKEHTYAACHYLIIYSEDYTQEYLIEHNSKSESLAEKIKNLDFVSTMYYHNTEDEDNPFFTRNLSSESYNILVDKHGFTFYLCNYHAYVNPKDIVFITHHDDCGDMFLKKLGSINCFSAEDIELQMSKLNRYFYNNKINEPLNNNPQQNCMINVDYIDPNKIQEEIFDGMVYVKITFNEGDYEQQMSFAESKDDFNQSVNELKKKQVIINEL